MSEVADGILVIPRGYPENLFDLGPVQAGPDEASASMPTGPWLLGPGGRPSPAGVGVLVDVVLGQAILNQRAAGDWAVTIETHLDVLAPLPTDGQQVDAVARPVSRDDAGGLAAAQVHDTAGRCLALANTWMRFIPGVPDAVFNPLPPTEIADRGQCLTGLLQVESDDTGRFDLPIRRDLGNPWGVVHGGVLLTLALLSAERLMGGTGLQTASVRIIYIRPAIGELSLQPTVLNRGRSLGVTRMDARTADGKLCTTATVSSRSAVGPPPVA